MIAPMDEVFMGAKHGINGNLRLSRRPVSAGPRGAAALGLLQEMTRNKVRVPEGISIIGHDDIDFAAAAAIPLTPVANPATNLAVQPHDSSLTRWQTERCTSTGRSSSSPI
jgi:Periplasmic binding protein-like domain